MARLFEICVQSVSHGVWRISPMENHAYHTLALFHINLVPEDDL